jgi:hypothetical protein
MKQGDVVLACVNGGQWTEAEVIEIIGTYIKVVGMGERAIVRETGNAPVGVCFPVQKLRLINKANFV